MRDKVIGFCGSGLGVYLCWLGITVSQISNDLAGVTATFEGHILYHDMRGHVPQPTASDQFAHYMGKPHGGSRHAVQD